MMGDLVLSATAPLYGRADEILKIAPLRAGWLLDHFPDHSAEAIVREFATWGGIPRYWESRSNYPDYVTAVDQLLLDNLGILHEEPNRLLLDDMREFGQAASLLSVVANGANKLSEIASRMNRPATDLNRPLNRLINLGYLKRERPFGASPRSKKNALYKIADPFMKFYYRYVFPFLSELEIQKTSAALEKIQATRRLYESETWEDMCRLAVSLGATGQTTKGVARRWWGKNTRGEFMEIDWVVDFPDGRLCAGECKWSMVKDAETVRRKLKEKAALLPDIHDREIVAFVAARDFKDNTVMSKDLTPDKVLSYLR